MAKQTTPGPTITTDGSGFAAARPVSAATRGVKPPDFSKGSYGDRTKSFMLGAHNTSWELVETTEGWRLLPTLKPLFFAPGVNWTPQAPKGGALDTTLLEAKGRSRLGFKMLADLDEYLVQVDGLNQGIFLKWERVRVYEDGAYEIAMDQAGYDAWRWSLVADRRVELPRESAIAQFRTRLRKQKERATRTPHLAQAQDALRQAEARQKGLDEAIAALSGKSSKREERDGEVA